MQQHVREVSGHVFVRRGRRGPRWYMKYRLPNGRQVQKTIGPAWTSRREKPPPGHFTKTGAQAVLDETLARVRRGELGGVVRTGATFAEAADEWLRYVERDRERKPSTITDYRHMADRLKRELGRLRLEDVTPERIESYRDSLIDRGLANRTINKYLIVLHGIFGRAMKVHRLPSNPLTLVEKRPNRGLAEIDVLSRDEVMALVDAAASECDAALSDGRVHRSSHGRALRASMARRRLRTAVDPRPPKLHRRQGGQPEVGARADCADGG